MGRAGRLKTIMILSPEEIQQKIKQAAGALLPRKCLFCLGM
jgi:hypothetical protein